MVTKNRIKSKPVPAPKLPPAAKLPSAERDGAILKAVADVVRNEVDSATAAMRDEITAQIPKDLPPPTIQNVVKVPEVYVTNNVPTQEVKVLNEVRAGDVKITVTTKELGAILSPIMDAMSKTALLLASLIEKLDAQHESVVNALSQRPAVNLSPTIRVPPPPKGEPKTRRFKITHNDGTEDYIEEVA